MDQVIKLIGRALSCLAPSGSRPWMFGVILWADRTEMARPGDPPLLPDVVPRTLREAWKEADLQK